MTKQKNKDLQIVMIEPRDKPSPDFYGINDPERLEYEDDDEAILAYLDGLYPDDLPETIELCGYARREVKPEFFKDFFIEQAFERLDEEFGDPDGDFTSKPTQKMKDAEKIFIEAILAEYEPWMCECVSREDIDVKEWVEKNAPHWLKEKAQNKRISDSEEEKSITLPPEMLGIWRCTCCKEECDAFLMGSSWRWEGSWFGHKCDKNIPQAGHFKCERIEPEVKS